MGVGGQSGADEGGGRKGREVDGLEEAEGQGGQVWRSGGRAVGGA